jgi:hypothetical protein
MASHVTITGGSIKNCGTGISLGKGSGRYEITDVDFDNCGTAILDRDAASTLARLGIPPGVPHKDVRDVLELLLSNANKTPEDRLAEVKGSKFWSAIQNSANSIAILQALFATAPGVLAYIKSML